MLFHLQHDPSVSVQHVLIPRTYFMTISPYGSTKLNGLLHARPPLVLLPNDRPWVIASPAKSQALAQCMPTMFSWWISKTWMNSSFLPPYHSPLRSISDASRTTHLAAKPISHSLWLFGKLRILKQPNLASSLLGTLWQFAFYHHYALALCTSYLFAHIIFRTDVLLRVISCVLVVSLLSKYTILHIVTN